MSTVIVNQDERLLIKQQLETVLSELREDYVSAKEQGSNLDEIIQLGKDCKAQLDMVNVENDENSPRLQNYGCVSFECNGLCYTCHTRPARPDCHNCVVCAGGIKVGRVNRTLEEIMDSLKKGIVGRSNEVVKAQTAHDAEVVFSV